MRNLSVEVLLTEDHERIDGLYLAYRKALESRLGVWKAFLDYESALLSHMKCEEDVIFRALLRVPSLRASQEVPVLEQEHETIRGLLARNAELISDRGQDLEICDRRLFEELHEHNAREEIHLYPVLDGSLSDEESEKVRKWLSPGAGIQ